MAHIYGGMIENYTRTGSKGKEVWMTDYLINSGNPPASLSINTGWTGAIPTTESINKCMNADINTYIWW